MATAVPKPGQIIYIDNQEYARHGIDDVAGGQATVVKVEERDYGLFITVREAPMHTFNWKFLEPVQDQLKAKFKDKVAEPKPDHRPQFNPRG